MPIPTKEMQQEAERGLAWRREYGPGEDGYPSNGAIAWKLWGGDPGYSWARRIVAAANDDRMGMAMQENLEDRHVQNVEETEDSYIITFAKAMHDQPAEAGNQYDDDDKDKRTEVRTLSRSVEVRAEGDGVKVSGYAAVFGEETRIGSSFTEVIAAGAFSSALQRGDDVVFLVNHAGLPLARTRSGTLRLTEDERGLYIETELDGSDPDVRAIIPKMQRGDLDKMSFAFIPTRQSWDDSGDMPKRTIEDVSLHDVSIVTTPAYAGTEIGLRSLEAFRAEHKQRSQAIRRLRMRSSLLPN